MSDGPEWFAPKRYGYGAGLPISWQGWALTAAFIATAGFCARFTSGKPLVAFAIMVPVTSAFLVIVARTTRGGWRWRWGEKD
ncbi:MAG TPA: hypothetical protein VF757_11600 [Sphingomicrobium sp.]